MTDEELLLWLRVEDTNLTDFAADRIEELTEQLAAEKGKVAALEWFAEISADEAFAVFSRVVGEAESHE